MTDRPGIDTVYQENRALEAEIERLRELLVETRAQIGFNTCGGDLHSPRYFAFLVHLSRELEMDPCTLGIPKWEPDEEASEEGVRAMIVQGHKEWKEKYG